MTHLLGLLCGLVALALATGAAVVAFGAVGAGIASLLWLALAALLIDLEAL